MFVFLFRWCCLILVGFSLSCSTDSSQKSSSSKPSSSSEASSQSPSSIESETTQEVEVSLLMTFSSLHRDHSNARQSRLIEAANTSQSSDSDCKLTAKQHLPNSDQVKKTEVICSLVVDLSNMTVSSSQPFLLVPGDYDLSLLFNYEGFQYKGSTQTTLSPGEQHTLSMDLSPVLGKWIDDVRLIENLPQFKLQVGSLENRVQPQLELSLDGELLGLFDLNTDAALTSFIIPEGQHTLEAVLLESGIPVAKTLSDQKPLSFRLEEEVVLSLIPFFSETSFTLTHHGGSLAFSFDISPQLVNYVEGDVDNLGIQLSVLSDDDPLPPAMLTIHESTAPENPELKRFFTSKQYENLNYSHISMILNFFDLTQSNTIPISSCHHDFEIDMGPQTLFCNLRLYQGASGQLFSTLGLTVYEESGEFAEGATVSLNGEVAGTTQTADDGNPGYFEASRVPGNYVIRAENQTKYGNRPISLYPLELSNVAIWLDQYISLTWNEEGTSWNNDTWR